MSGTRVVLVKPGDVLVFGNVGELAAGALDCLEPLKEQLGLAAVVVFEGDINLAAVPSGGA